ncbi:MAG: cytochrome c oxidase subunit I [Bacillota bacterium]|nr:cytochrome c oxidase subunit I [Bacillota bacterium]
MATHDEVYQGIRSGFALPRPQSTTGFWSWVTTVDHKRIGIMYFVTSIFFFLVGGIEALFIRAQLFAPNLNLISADRFNQLFTMHGTTMVFLAVMPLSAAFFNYLLPLMLGARDVAFPRLNAFSYWMYLFGGIFINLGWFVEAVPAVGWFGYANLTSTTYTPGLATDYWALGLQILGIGTLVSGFNFIVTILNMRAPGMTLMKMPVFAWTTLVTSFLIIFSFPSVTVGLLLLTFDRLFGANFFEVAANADVVLWQHLFWIFGHPEVYILILPAMGIVSEILPTFARKPLFGYSVMVFSTMLIGFMGFMVWSHHMFTVGLGPVVNSIFSLATMAIAIPTGVKIFNWISTLWGGSIRFRTPLLFALGFIFMFMIGGLSGVMHSSAPSNAQQQDTYFVVAHFHYVLIGGAIFALFAGIYYWFPKVTGRLMNETLGKLNFILMFIGFNVTFFPMHFLGLMGMPRRIYTYGPELGLTFWNQVSTVGAFILAVGVAVFLVNLAVSLRRGEIAAADPWDARTLEWMTSNPPPVYNFAEIPVVSARDEFWARKYEGVAARESAAAHENSGERGIHLPGNSYFPILMAAGITIFSLGLLYHAAVTFTGLAITVLSLFGWAFEGVGGTIVYPEGEAR